MTPIKALPYFVVSILGLSLLILVVSKPIKK